MALSLSPTWEQDKCAKFPISVEGVSRCWVWAGNTDREGYPMLKGKRAHRLVFTELVGPIPKGKELDHLCRVRQCVRPEHLEPVSRSENERRKAWSYRVARKLCPNGHSLAKALRTKQGGKLCRECQV